jgi:hypothetical protein
MPDDWHQTDFDPFEHLMKLTQIINDLTAAHNRLSADHIRVSRQLVELQRELELLRPVQIKT